MLDWSVYVSHLLLVQHHEFYRQGRTQPLLQITVSSPSSNALAWWIRNAFSVSYTCQMQCSD